MAPCRERHLSHSDRFQLSCQFSHLCRLLNPLAYTASVINQSVFINLNNTTKLDLVDMMQ